MAQSASICARAGPAAAATVAPEAASVEPRPTSTSSICLRARRRSSRVMELPSELEERMICNNRISDRERFPMGHWTPPAQGEERIVPHREEWQELLPVLIHR